MKSSGKAGISPLAQRDLDEALRLAVGAQGLGAGETVLDVLLVNGFAEAPVAVAASVVGKQAMDGDAEAGVMSAGPEEKTDGRVMGLIRQDGGEADAGVVIDGNVQVFPTSAADLLSTSPWMRWPGLTMRARLSDTRVDRKWGHVRRDAGFEHVRPLSAVDWSRQLAIRFGIELHVVRNPNKTYLEMIRRRGADQFRSSSANCRIRYSSIACGCAPRNRPSVHDKTLGPETMD